MPHPVHTNLAAYINAHRSRGEAIIKAADTAWAALRTPPPPPPSA